MRVSILTYIFPVVAICVLLIVYASATSTTCEGFDTKKPVLASCPKDSYVFITKAGDMDCCANEPEDSTCRSVTCTLSPEHDSIKTCISLLQSRFNEAENRFCTVDKPTYFESENGSGCLRGDRLPDGSPKPGADVCYFYDNQDDNYSKQDSCILQKAKDNFMCPWDDATISLQDGTPSVLICKSIKEDGIQQCGEDKTLMNYLNKTVPNWRTTFNSSQKSQFCSIIVSSMAEGRDPSSYDWPV
jgi:hypothetical protein